MATAAAGSRDHVARSQCLVKHPLGTPAAGWWLVTIVCVETTLQISPFSPFSIFFTFSIPDTETILVSADKRGPRPLQNDNCTGVLYLLICHWSRSAQLAGESVHCAALIGARCWAHGALVQTITINTGHRDTLRSHSPDTDGGCEERRTCGHITHRDRAYHSTCQRRAACKSHLM